MQRSAPETPSQAVPAAVLDMGSTSFNLLVADVTQCGSVEPIRQKRTMLRLGSAIATHGRIPKKLRARAVSAARELGQIVYGSGVPHFYPVATAALREARNGGRVARMIERALDRRVHILSGREEARVIFRALQARLDLGEEPVLGLDLGGGSLELAVGRGSEIDAEATLRLGVVRLVRELVCTDPISRSEMKDVRKRVRQTLRPLHKRIHRAEPGQAVATGGTARGLARLLVARVTGRTDLDDAPVRVTLEELEDLAEELLRSSHAERVAMPGMRLRRADLLPTGALVFVTLCQELGLGGLTLCDWGLREGVLLCQVAGSDEALAHRD